MSKKWNKFALIEDLLYRKTYPSVEDLQHELGDSDRNVKKLISDLREMGRDIKCDHGGYYWGEEPSLPLLVEGGYAGAFENDLIVSHAFRFGLEITLVTKGDHREYRIVPILLTRVEGRVVLRAVVIPNSKLKDFPLDSWTFCTAEKFCGDWDIIRGLAKEASFHGAKSDESQGGMTNNP